MTSEPMPLPLEEDQTTVAAVQPLDDEPQNNHATFGDRTTLSFSDDAFSDDDDEPRAIALTEVVVAAASPRGRTPAELLADGVVLDADEATQRLPGLARQTSFLVEIEQSVLAIRLAKGQIVKREMEREEMRAKRIAQFFVLFQFGMLINATISLISGVRHYTDENSKCANPLPQWHITNFCNSVWINLFMLLSKLSLHYAPDGTPHPASLYWSVRFQRLGLGCILFMLIWTIPGGVWSFGPNCNDCDGSTLYASRTNVCTMWFLLTLKLLLSPVLYRLYKRSQAKKKEKALERVRAIEDAAMAKAIIFGRTTTTTTTTPSPTVDVTTPSKMMTLLNDANAPPVGLHSVDL